MELRSVMRTAADMLLILFGALLLLLILTQPRAILEDPSPAQEPTGIGKYPPNGVKQAPRNYSAPYLTMEKSIFDMVNGERAAEGLDALAWNADVAAVARNHSMALAIENDPFTERDLLCYVPLIHHEGFINGLHHDKRLENNSVYYFASSGENIFLASNWKTRKTFDVDEINCSWNAYMQNATPSEIKWELEKRLDEVKSIQRVKWLFTLSTKEEIKDSIVNGWMNSTDHRANILNGNFNEGGIGIAQTNDFYIVTQVFIERVDCGYRDGPCCQEEGFYPYCYEPLKCDVSVCK